MHALAGRAAPRGQHGAPPTTTTVVCMYGAGACVQRHYRPAPAVCLRLRAPWPRARPRVEVCVHVRRRGGAHLCVALCRHCSQSMTLHGAPPFPLCPSPTHTHTLCTHYLYGVLRFLCGCSKEAVPTEVVLSRFMLWPTRFLLQLCGVPSSSSSIGVSLALHYYRLWHAYILYVCTCGGRAHEPSGKAAPLGCAVCFPHVYLGHCCWRRIGADSCGLRATTFLLCYTAPPPLAQHGAAYAHPASAFVVLDGLRSRSIIMYVSCMGALLHW